MDGLLGVKGWHLLIEEQPEILLLVGQLVSVCVQGLEIFGQFLCELYRSLFALSERFRQPRAMIGVRNTQLNKGLFTCRPSRAYTRSSRWSRRQRYSVIYSICDLWWAGRMFQPAPWRTLERSISVYRS